MKTEIETLSSRTVYANRWISVREDAVRFASGHEGIYGVIDKPDFVLVVPLHDDGRIELVEQYRYPLSRRFWEAPQGGWPAERKATPEEVARGELAEETGFRAASMTPIGHFHQAPGLLNQGYQAFLAKGLVPGQVQRDIEEQGMMSRAFTLDEVVAMIAKGQIKDAPTIAALGLLRLTGQI